MKRRQPSLPGVLPGARTLKVYMIDPGVVLDELTVATSDSPDRHSRGGSR